jgi:Sporulation protein YtfJ (Spore_YtfJ)
MTTELEQAARVDASQSGYPTPADRLLVRLAELVGAKAGVQVVFGEPTTRGDLTVIPVARVRWGFGGGGGRAETPPAGPASGSGGGGGVAADPVGYLELGSEGAAFRPIRDPFPSPMLLIASALSASIVLRALARLAGR